MVVSTGYAPLGTDEHPIYIIPRGKTLVCGGTYLEGDSKAEPRQEELDRIKAGVETVFPVLKKQRPVTDWVGFRPARQEGIRFQAELGEGVPVFHNYGHGGSGWTIGEGAAIATANEIQKFLATTDKSRL